jgi:hypothetical protein
MNKNNTGVAPKYGLIIDTIKPEDYILGGLTKLPKEVLQENKDWTPHLPAKELQAEKFETWACATFTVLNCIEILIKRKYNEKRNYSDRFLAVVSGTTKGGNSPHTVAEFLRKIGVVPEEIYPFDAKNYEEFYKPIPPKLYELAREFNEEWDFRHEFVKGEDIDEAIQYSPLLISVAAWFKKKGDYYYRPKGMKDNHAVTYVKREKDCRLIFDSYDEILKKVRLEDLPMIAKRFWIEKKSKKKDGQTDRRSLSLKKKEIHWFIKWLIKLLWKK